jgi:predicted transcriptional regulator
MTKPSRANPGKEMITVYGKIPKDLADRLDRLADQRRWSRAQMVAYCIEHFIQNNPAASAGSPEKDKMAE